MRRLKAHHEPRVVTVSLFALIAACAISAGCGGGSVRQASEEETQKVASAFARAVERHDSNAAFALGVPGLALEPEYSFIEKKRLRLASRARPSCPTDEPGFKMPAGDCFQFLVCGKPIADPKNAGVSWIAFGRLFVSVDRRDPPRVNGVSFLGGATSRNTCPYLASGPAGS